MNLIRTSHRVVERRFATLLEQPVWVAWKEIDRAGRKVKLPIDPGTGKSASVAQPETWAPYATVSRFSRKSGIGIVLGATAVSRLVGIDLDTCRDKGTGEVADWARLIMSMMMSYAEVSPSASGLKIFATMSEEGWAQARRLLGPGLTRMGASWKAAGDNHPPGVEFYLGSRYFTVTGAALNEMPLRQITADDVSRLIAFCKSRFGHSSSSVRVPASARMSGSRDLSESGRAFRVCLAAVRAGVAIDDVPQWATRVAASHTDGSYTVSEEYWLRERNGGTQLMRDYARAQSIIEARKKD